ncbi:DUF5081 family protein [uncultured Enterococcus sp.]|uniref:DUF5081 family protein n=1 Tax=uncultured Enterococcus sp. TaxID=167972 RepID=UPI002AA8C64E|nr:DUF5081 family protein [uncultured Enterococcus sp.]
MTIFSEEELLVLTDMVGQVELFGVPQLQAYRFTHSTALPIGIARLEKKKLLTDGKLTEQGFLVASLIEKYGQAESYLCLDQTYYIAAGEQSIVLKKQTDGYRLTIDEPESVLGQLLLDYTILRREGTEEEQNFRTRRARITLEELREQKIEAALVMGSIHKMANDLERTEFALLLSQGTLYRLDNERLKRVSQFWVNKWLIDELQISYEMPNTQTEGLVK